jgi:hypothetical protein
MQNDGVPLRLGEFPQRGHQQDMVGRDRLDGVRIAAPGPGHGRVLGLAPPGHGQPIGDGPQPGLRGVDQGELVAAFPGAGERLLDDVLGLGEVAAHGVHLSDEPTRIRRVELVELGDVHAALGPPLRAHVLRCHP